MSTWKIQHNLPEFVGCQQHKNNNCKSIWTCDDIWGGTLVASRPLAASASSPRLLGKKWYWASSSGNLLAKNMPLLKNLKCEQPHGGWKAYTPTSYSMCPNTGFSVWMSFLAALLSNTSSRHSMSTLAGNREVTSQGTLPCWRRPWDSKARGALRCPVWSCWLEFWLELKPATEGSSASSQGTDTTWSPGFGAEEQTSDGSTRLPAEGWAVGRVLLDGLRVPQLLGESTKMRILGRHTPWAMRWPMAVALCWVCPRLLKRARLSGNRHKLAVANPNDTFVSSSKPLRVTSSSEEDGVSWW